MSWNPNVSPRPNLLTNESFVMSKFSLHREQLTDHSSKLREQFPVQDPNRVYFNNLSDPWFVRQLRGTLRMRPKLWSGRIWRGVNNIDRISHLLCQPYLRFHAIFCTCKEVTFKNYCCSSNFRRLTTSSEFLSKHLEFLPLEMEYKQLLQPSCWFLFSLCQTIAVTIPKT